MGRISTIAPASSFLADVAKGLMHDLGGELADTLVLLPSRRACLGFRDALLDQLGEDDAILAPRILPMGDIDCVSLQIDPPARLPVAIESIERGLIFARLIRQEREAGTSGITDEHALRLGDELGKLIDEFATEEIPTNKLEDLVPEQFAEHWQRILVFLDLVSSHWPKILAATGKVDGPERRRLALDQVRDQWRANPPDYPVIAAGMTGTIPCVARLLGEIISFERGQLILPGLDLDMSERDWQAAGRTPSHPQYGLFKLLETLNSERGSVKAWPHQTLDEAGFERVLFLTEIMRPAETSQDWRLTARPKEKALASLKRAAMADKPEESALITFQIRDALNDPASRVALVTSDRNLARSVGIRLQSLGIEAVDSAGTPLDQTPPGSLIILAARALVEQWAPVPLLALLKHPLVACGRERASFRRLVRTMECRLFRQPRITGGFEALREELRSSDTAEIYEGSDRGEIDALLADLAAHAPEVRQDERGSRFDFKWLLDRHLRFCRFLASDETENCAELFAKNAGREAADLIDRLVTASPNYPTIGLDAFPVLLAILMAEQAVFEDRPGHPRVQILGQFESRLLHADRVLIAGLEEGVWPRAADPSPWLNRAMREKIGLPPLDARTGMAAHDFCMAAARPDVLLTMAAKDWQGAPVTPSRWLSRLNTHLKSHAMENRLDLDPAWHAYVRMRVKPEIELAPMGRPVPKPPLAARPRDFSVTDIETLIRDPYSFYARRILGLSALDPVDADPGAAERGSIIHKALEIFVGRAATQFLDDPYAELIAIGRQLFSRLDHHPDIRILWWPKFEAIAEWFIDQHQKTTAEQARIWAELTGEIELRAQSGPLRLKARADRVALDSNGAAGFVDYKTGATPKKWEVAAGISPQLSLTGLIAQKGGFVELGARDVANLHYWALKSGATPSKVQEAADPENIAGLLGDAEDGLIRLVDYFSHMEIGYSAVPRPEIASTFSDYDHLARIDEWRGQDD